jgi:hypothetical protein
VSPLRNVQTHVAKRVFYYGVMEDKPEFFKLDAIDREVLFWIMTHASKSLSSWIDYIVLEYGKKMIYIDAEKLYKEALEKEQDC